MICTLCYIQYAVSMSMKENTLNKRWHSRNWKRGYCIVDTKFICTTNCGFETENFRYPNNKRIYLYRQDTLSDVFALVYSCIIQNYRIPALPYQNLNPGRPHRLAWSRRSLPFALPLSHRRRAFRFSWTLFPSVWLYSFSLQPLPPFVLSSSSFSLPSFVSSLFPFVSFCMVVVR